MCDGHLVLLDQRDEGLHGSLDMPLLDFGVWSLASLQQCVATKCDDESHRRGPGCRSSRPATECRTAVPVAVAPRGTTVPITGATLRLVEQFAGIAGVTDGLVIVPEYHCEASQAQRVRTAPPALGPKGLSLPFSEIRIAVRPDVVGEAVTASLRSRTRASSGYPAGTRSLRPSTSRRKPSSQICNYSGPSGLS